MEVIIYHQRDKGKFYTVVRGHEAFMKYAKPDQDTLEVQSIHIPSTLRGQGIAGRMAEFACNYAREKHLRLKASCPYLAQFLENNPEVYRNVNFA